MYDLVLNHASQQHEWFQEYLKGDPQYCRLLYRSGPDSGSVGGRASAKPAAADPIRFCRWPEEHLDYV